VKALFVTHSFPRFDGDAAGSFILRLATSLAGEGVDVRVIAPSAPGLDSRSVIRGIDIRRFRYASRSSETLAYRGTMAEDVSHSLMGKARLGSFIVSETAVLRSEAAAWKPDVIHAHWWFPNGVAAATASRMRDVPLVTTSHGTDLRLLQNNGAARPIAKYVFRRSARVTCVSSWLAAIAAPFCTVAPVVAPMPADVSIFGGSSDSDRDANRIIFVGRLTRQKGIEDAIRALALMRRSVVLDVIGDGADRAAMMTLANELGLGERILWHGHVAHASIPALVSRASVLIAPFRDEGLGLVAVEAQLSETVPVAFASGGLTDVIEDEVTGLLVPAGDIAALAAAAGRIVADPARRAQIGRAGREYALRTFSPERAAANYAAIYRDAIADSSSPFATSGNAN
jgi:glycosyltransferase involved in cell wall biosynthesis